MPTPNSDTDEPIGGDGLFTLLLIISAVFFVIAIAVEYSELSSHYNWPGGESSDVAVTSTQ